MTDSTDILTRAKAQQIICVREMAEAGETVIAPGIVPELVAEIERLRAENGRLRNAFRVLVDRKYAESGHPEGGAANRSDSAVSAPPGQNGVAAQTLTLPLSWSEWTNGDADLFAGPFKVGSVYVREGKWNAFGSNFWHHITRGHASKETAQAALVKGLSALGVPEPSAA